MFHRNLVWSYKFTCFSFVAYLCGNLTHVNELFDFWLPQIAADLRSQQHTCRRYQLPVLLVETSLQHKLLKVNKRHRCGDRLQAELLAHGAHLPLQAVGKEVRASQLLVRPPRVLSHLVCLLLISWRVDGLGVFPPCMVWFHTSKMSREPKSINQTKQLWCENVLRKGVLCLKQGQWHLCVPPYLAQSQLDVRKLLLESLIHVLLQVRWFHILDNSRLQRQLKKTKTRQKKNKPVSTCSA